MSYHAVTGEGPNQIKSCREHAINDKETRRLLLRQEQSLSKQELGFTSHVIRREFPPAGETEPPTMQSSVCYCDLSSLPNAVMMKGKFLLFHTCCTQSTGELSKSSFHLIYCWYTLRFHSHVDTSVCQHPTVMSEGVTHSFSHQNARWLNKRPIHGLGNVKISWHNHPLVCVCALCFVCVWIFLLLGQFQGSACKFLVISLGIVELIAFLGGKKQGKFLVFYVFIKGHLLHIHTVWELVLDISELRVHIRVQR